EVEVFAGGCGGEPGGGVVLLLREGGLADGVADAGQIFGCGAEGVGRGGSEWAADAGRAEGAGGSVVGGGRGEGGGGGAAGGDAAAGGELVRAGGGRADGVVAGAGAQADR